VLLLRLSRLRDFDSGLMHALGLPTTDNNKHRLFITREQQNFSIKIQSHFLFLVSVQPFCSLEIDQVHLRRHTHSEVVYFTRPNHKSPRERNDMFEFSRLSTQLYLCENQVINWFPPGEVYNSVIIDHKVLVVCVGKLPHYRPFC
jgi:hypothetical protein